MRWYQDRLFPKLLDWATRPLYRDRQRLLQGARGRVLELGIGTGANHRPAFILYPCRIRIFAIALLQRLLASGNQPWFNVRGRCFHDLTPSV